MNIESKKETSLVNAESYPPKLEKVPVQWIGRIFSVMEATYGSLFLDRWKGADLQMVKDVWADGLASFTDDPKCFGRALKELQQGSPFPPTLPEFVALCRKNYERPDKYQALAYKPMSKHEAEEAMNRLFDARKVLGI